MYLSQKGVVTLKYYDQVKMTRETYERIKGLSYSGVIHSIFNHTVNLLVDETLLITIADESVAFGPNSISVNGLNIATLHLSVNDSVNIKDEMLTINNKLIVNFQNVTIIDFDKIKHSHDSSLIKEKVNTVQKSEWYQSQQKNLYKHLLAEAVSAQLIENQQILKVAVAAKSTQQMIEALNNYIGLGIGLTPSGDDFLTGLAFVASLENYPNERLKEALHTVLETVEKKTNVISESQYKMALQKEARYEVVQATQALLSDHAYDVVEQSIKSILSIGSSSGFDLLQGILFGLQIT